MYYTMYYTAIKQQSKEDIEYLPQRKGALYLGDLIHEFNFEVVYGPEGFEKTEITKDDVNRPGLQLAGFFDYFDPNRIQIMGKVESSYVEGLSSEERRSRFDRLFETGIRAAALAQH